MQAPREWATRRVDPLAYGAESAYPFAPGAPDLQSPRTWDPAHGYGSRGERLPEDGRPMSHEDKRVMQSQLVLLKQKMERKQTRGGGRDGSRLLRSDSLRNGAAGAAERRGHRFEPGLYEDPKPAPIRKDARAPGRSAHGAEPAPLRFDPPPGESLERQRGAGAYARREADELSEDDPGDMVQCNGCGRSFNEAAYQKHARVCKKVFGEKRKAFDSAAARLDGLDESKAADLLANARKIEKEKDQAVNGLKPLKSKQTKWRMQSEMFRAAIQAARGEASGDTEAADDARRRAAALQEEDDTVQKCPHCQRTFNPEAAKRHIPICQKTFGTKPGGGRLKKGAGIQCATTVSGSANVSSGTPTARDRNAAIPRSGAPVRGGGGPAGRRDSNGGVPRAGGPPRR